MRFWLAVAGISGFLAVAAGAFAAHGLEGRLSERMLAAFHTGADYHLLHSVALLAVAAFGAAWERPGAWRWAAWLFLAGVLLFSGSLYGLALTGWRPLAYVTPAGGVCFLGGWACVAWRAAQGGLNPINKN